MLCPPGLLLSCSKLLGNAVMQMSYMNTWWGYIQMGSRRTWSPWEPQGHQFCPALPSPCREVIMAFSSDKKFHSESSNQRSFPCKLFFFFLRKGVSLKLYINDRNQTDTDNFLINKITENRMVNLIIWEICLFLVQDWHRSFRTKEGLSAVSQNQMFSSALMNIFC